MGWGVGVSVSGRDLAPQTPLGMPMPSFPKGLLGIIVHLPVTEVPTLLNIVICIYDYNNASNIITMAPQHHYNDV